MIEIKYLGSNHIRTFETKTEFLQRMKDKYPELIAYRVTESEAKLYYEIGVDLINEPLPKSDTRLTDLCNEAVDKMWEAQERPSPKSSNVVKTGWFDILYGIFAAEFQG